MLDSKKFLYMTVLNEKGKKIGYIKDLILNVSLKKVSGFETSTIKIFKKFQTISYRNIISYDNIMIISENSSIDGIRFSKLKSIDVMDTCGNIIGMVFDVIFDDNFNLKGIIVTEGFLNDCKYGKKILLLDEIIIGDEYILYTRKNRFVMRSMIHSV